MLKLSCKFGVSKWNPYWFIALINSTGTNYVLNENEDIDRYGSLVSFHKDFSPSGEQLEHRKLAHEL